MTKVVYADIFKACASATASPERLQVREGFAGECARDYVRVKCVAFYGGKRVRCCLS